VTALLIALFVVVLLAVEAVVLYRRRASRDIVAAGAGEAAREPRPPFGLFVDEGHAWLRLQPDGTLRIGVDDFLTEAMGSVESLEVAGVGTKVERGDPLVTLRSGGRQLVVASPAAGEVRAVNDRVLRSPSAIAADPYGVGWVAALWTRDHKEAIQPLHVGNGALALLRNDLGRLIDFLATSSATTAPLLADGGLPRRGALQTLSDDSWRSFQSQFLTPRRR